MDTVAIRYLSNYKQLTTGLTSPFLEARQQARITVRASIFNFGLRAGPSLNGLPNFGLRDGPSLNGIPNFGLRDGPSLNRFEKIGLRAETVLKFGQKGSDRGPITSRAQARFNSNTLFWDYFCYHSPGKGDCVKNYDFPQPFLKVESFWIFLPNHIEAETLEIQIFSSSLIE